VWDGNGPRRNPAFGHGEYCGRRPRAWTCRFGNLMDQHDKVARIEGNQDVLDDLVEEIFL
jgi:hypothetical protein